MSEKRLPPAIDVETVKKAFKVWKGVRIEVQSGSSYIDYTPYSSQLVFIRLNNYTTGEWRMVAALPRPSDDLEDAVVAALIELYSCITGGNEAIQNLIEKLLLLASLYKVGRFSIQIAGGDSCVEIMMTAGEKRWANVKVSEYFKLWFSPP